MASSLLDDHIIPYRMVRGNARQLDQLVPPLCVRVEDRPFVFFGAAFAPIKILGSKLNNFFSDGKRCCAGRSRRRANVEGRPIQHVPFEDKVGGRGTVVVEDLKTYVDIMN